MQSLENLLQQASILATDLYGRMCVLHSLTVTNQQPSNLIDQITYKELIGGVAGGFVGYVLMGSLFHKSPLQARQEAYDMNPNNKRAISEAPYKAARFNNIKNAAGTITGAILGGVAAHSLWR